MTPYYDADGITIYHGDCREVNISNVSAVVTDPPYGTEDLAGGYGRRQLWDTGDGKGRTIKGDHDLTTFADRWPHIKTTVQYGWAAVFFAARRTPDFVRIVGADWFGEVVWVKGPGMGHHLRYCHESISILRIGEPTRPPKPLMSAQRFPKVSDLHPHQKPYQLMLNLVQWTTPRGTTVLDPFMGSGTTLVAAKNLGRKAIGIEIEERYCEIAAQRLCRGVLNLGDSA